MLLSLVLLILSICKSLHLLHLQVKKEAFLMKAKNSTNLRVQLALSVCLSIYLSIYLSKGNLLPWLTGYGPASPTMVTYQQKSQESRTCSFYKAGCLNWFSVCVGIWKKSALTPVTWEQGQAGKRQRLASSMFFVWGHRWKVWCRFEVDLPISNN